MNAKLHNTLPALAVSTALLVAGLLIVAPASGLGVTGSMVSTADVAGLATPTDAMERATDTPDATGTTGHYRQRFVAMPYFSFVPAGLTQ